MRTPKKSFTALLGCLALAGGLTGCTATAAATKTVDKPAHLFYIMMENHGYSQIVGNTADAPYINALAATNGVATHFHGVTHPSLPNYLSILSGDFQGIWDDCPAGAAVTCAPEEFVKDSGDPTSSAALTPAQVEASSKVRHLFAGTNLVDQLEANKLSWKAYMQSMPSGGFAGEYSPKIGGQVVKLYAQKHNPFMYFTDIATNPKRVTKIVPMEGNLAADLSSGNVPNFVWISPDQCHDMHAIKPAAAALIKMPLCAAPASGLDHTSIRLGDDFLKKTIAQIEASPVWSSSNSSIIISWDENDYAGYSGAVGSPVGAGGAVLGGGDAPVIVVNSRGPRHVEATQLSDHYSMLATIEKLWHLECLAEACSVTPDDMLTSLFHS